MTKNNIITFGLFVKRVIFFLKKVQQHKNKHYSFFTRKQETIRKKKAMETASETVILTEAEKANLRKRKFSKQTRKMARSITGINSDLNQPHSAIKKFISKIVNDNLDLKAYFKARKQLQTHDSADKEKKSSIGKDFYDGFNMYCNAIVKYLICNLNAVMDTTNKKSRRKDGKRELTKITVYPRCVLAIASTRFPRDLANEMISLFKDIQKEVESHEQQQKLRKEANKSTGTNSRSFVDVWEPTTFCLKNAPFHHALKHLCRDRISYLTSYALLSVVETLMKRMTKNALAFVAGRWTVEAVNAWRGNDRRRLKASDLLVGISYDKPPYRPTHGLSTVFGRNKGLINIPTELCSTKKLVKYHPLMSWDEDMEHVNKKSKKKTNGHVKE